MHPAKFPASLGLHPRRWRWIAWICDGSVFPGGLSSYLQQAGKSCGKAYLATAPSPELTKAASSLGDANVSGRDVFQLPPSRGARAAAFRKVACGAASLGEDEFHFPYSSADETRGSGQFQFVIADLEYLCETMRACCGAACRNNIVFSNPSRGMQGLSQRIAVSD